MSKRERVLLYAGLAAGGFPVLTFPDPKLKRLYRAGSVPLIALAFAAALTFGVSQTVSASANRSICDTPPGVCTDNDDCVFACKEYNGTEFGGGCIPSVGCCICLE